MNWLDEYIKKNEAGYLINGRGGIFVSLDKNYVRHVKGDKELENLKEISKDLFIEKLIH